MMSQILTNIMLMVAFGTFLDTVLVGKEGRKTIERYLEERREEYTISVRFQKFLSLSHSIVFDRFFSAKIFSMSFIFSAAIVSVFSFICVSALQIYFNLEALADVSFDVTQILIIISFLLFNILFDYLTIIQTKVFIEASISAKSIFRSLIFITSDLIVTMNSFILLYAYFILFVVQYFVWSDQNLNFVRVKNSSDNVSLLKDLPTYLAVFEAQEDLQRLQYSDHFSGALTSPTSSSAYRKVDIYYDSTIDPRTIDLDRIILAMASRLNVRVGAEFQDLPQEEAEKMVSDDIFLDGIDRWTPDKTPLAARVIPPIEEISVTVNGRITTQAASNAAYTMAFSQTDALEDGFPMSVLGGLIVLPLSKFIADTISIELVAAPIAICFLDEQNVTRFNLSSETLPYLDRCEDFITLEFLWHWGYTRDLSTSGRDLENSVVPYNTLLITSLLPTLFFYFSVILMAIATFLFSYFINKTNKFRLYFLRAPLSITCFFLSILISLLGWL